MAGGAQARHARRGGTAAVAFQRDLRHVEGEADARKAIEAQGCEIVELTGDEHDAFAAAVEPLRASARGTFGREMFELVADR